MERVRQATIDLSALRANFALAQEFARGGEVIAVVKADAYGHGAQDVARCLEAAGTLAYELLVRVGDRVPRVSVDSE